MDVNTFCVVILTFLIGCQAKYCTVTVAGNHHSPPETFRIQCSSSCCGSGYNTKCCVAGDMIVAIFFSCVACVTILVTLVYCCCKHKFNRSSNSRSQGDFSGHQHRFYPAEPIKPPPYLLNDRPPSYSEIAETSNGNRRISTPWTPHTPSSSPLRPSSPIPGDGPRYIVVSSPPPPYSPPHQSTVMAVSGDSTRETTAVPNNNPTLRGETSNAQRLAVPPLSLGRNSEIPVANQERLDNIFTVTQVPNTTRPQNPTPAYGEIARSRRHLAPITPRSGEESQRSVRELQIHVSGLQSQRTERQSVAGATISHDTPRVDS